MKIKSLSLLPTLAIGRLGSAQEPLDNYEIVTDPEAPLDFRKVQRAETLLVDTESGAITGKLPPSEQPPEFKSGDKIRPVAPFIEAFVALKNDQDHKYLEPLTQDILEQFGLTPRWHIEAGNFKVFRRTNDPDDKVIAHLDGVTDHCTHLLQGRCAHFINDDHGQPKYIPFGHIQFLRPTCEFPEIRLRFTPGKGLVYGSTPLPDDPDIEIPQEMGGPAYSDIDIPPERTVYDSHRGNWNGKYRDDQATLNTLAQGLYAAYGKAPYFNYYENPQPARGYLDDACDGIVTLELVDDEGTVHFNAKARFCAAPPIFAPDSEFVRTIEDDLKQVLLGPKVEQPGDVALQEAKNIVRRAYETVRFMNLSVLNGDTQNGRPNRADTMSGNDSEDLNRPLDPIMTEHTIDTLSITALHQQLYTTLSGGVPPWFHDLLRMPDEVADLTTKGRRKMPAMMSGADARYLALTYRQLNTIKHAGRGYMFETPPTPEDTGLTPMNLTAQLHYRGTGNPANTHISSSVGNCCPGLELDFRSVWKRAFEGITLVEHDNYVLETSPEYEHLLGHRLLSIDIPNEDGEIETRAVVVQAIGPSPDGSTVGPLGTDDNPDGVVNLEWSNTLSAIWKHKGQYLTCRFTKEKMLENQVLADIPEDQTITAQLKVRDFFESDSTMISEALASPGELTQGLCSPWQNDFRECVCYYWASSRPDYVNVEPADNGGSRGDNWMQKKRTGNYVVDDYKDNRLINYQELFTEWESLLQFQLGGRDVPDKS
ncbi:hypothetical protein OLMES_1342 [Oleiphilus messinensis]|uniref:Uncharacterized protein n=1 Tax=Oleiphilus messinensis TaxID=141451 RepID=A0A1Y0I598_9GAMM|nr:hypothetical protein [Oleiphilus messinensis]ARU55420.1 hypothetical protein OLMES_1342 [Oleiphilus messinensis]